MWKENWEQTKSRFDDFWKRNGFVLATWNGYFPTNRLVRAEPAWYTEEDRIRLEELEKTESWDTLHLDPRMVALHQYRAISRGIYPGDLMPFAYCDWGTVTLAPMLGARQHFSRDTVWYTHERMPLSAEEDRSLLLEQDNEWFVNLQELARVGTECAAGRYPCGAPAIFGGLDVLSELRGASELCMDLLLEPDWVLGKLKEIDIAAEQAYHTMYDIIRDEEGSMFHAFFMFWARGKASLLQCDFASLISESMFREFAVPSIRKACSYLDYALYHVDGPDALRTVDALLEIEELDCLEFTPGPQLPQGGDPCWYPLYRKIKESGKCVQAVEMQPEEVVPLLDAVGPDGMYLMVNFRNEQEILDLNRSVQSYR